MCTHNITTVHLANATIVGHHMVLLKSPTSTNHLEHVTPLYLVNKSAQVSRGSDQSNSNSNDELILKIFPCQI